jgi:hypothetical protein
MDFLIEKFKMQLDDLWTEEVRDAKVELLMNFIYSGPLDEFNRYMN